MSFEPTKFFIGLVDFFSILMPGALVVYLGVANLDHGCAKLVLPTSLTLDLKSAEGVLVFLFLSYLLGHFLFLIGSLIDDLVYDPIRKATDNEQATRLSRGRDLSARPFRYVAQRWFKKNPDRAINRILSIKKATLARIGDDEAVNAFQWCKARLALESPEALAIVNRFEADSKFFRSFVPVLAGLWLVILCCVIFEAMSQPSLKPTNGGVIGGLVLLFILSFLIGLSFWRYVEQRFKATQQAYWFVLTMEAGKEGKNIQTERRIDGLTHAGGVVVRRGRTGQEYLLVQAKKNPKEWVLPKGHIEPDEDLQHCAIREVHEETGVWARITKPLDVKEYELEKKQIREQFYLMEMVEADKAEDPERKSVWVSLDDALERTKSIEQTYKLLQKFKEEGQ